MIADDYTTVEVLDSPLPGADLVRLHRRRGNKAYLGHAYRRAKGAPWEVTHTPRRESTTEPLLPTVKVGNALDLAHAARMLRHHLRA